MTPEVSPVLAADPVIAEPVVEDETPPSVEIPEQDREVRLAVTLKTRELFAERSKGKDLEEDEECQADAHKRAKKAREAQDERIKECIDSLEALVCNEPDPARYPLLDKPAQPTLAEVAAQFAKPEAIQPLVAKDREEFFRRKRRDTRLEDIGLTSKVTEILAGAGYNTILDLDRVFASEAGFKAVKCAAGTITSDRGDKITDAIAHHAAIWQKEWEASQSAPVAELAEAKPE